jgi:hypothetical protein
VLHALLSALEAMSEGTASALTTDQGSYLAQTIDLAADFDIVVGELPEALSDPKEKSSRSSS